MSELSRCWREGWAQDLNSSEAVWLSSREVASLSRLAA